jgi:uncharacterized repeat protein (TIGR02543 family)
MIQFRKSLRTILYSMLILVFCLLSVGLAQNYRNNRYQSEKKQGNMRTITVIKSGKGMGTVSLAPSGPTFRSGTIVSLMATPDDRSTFTGWYGGCTGISPVCQITVNTDVNLKARFELKGSTVTATAGTGGSISPSGTVPVSYGDDQVFKIKPTPKYRIADVKVDGISLGAVDKYTFSGVVGDHTIAVTFAPITYSLTVVIAGRGRGSVITAPLGTVFTAGTTVNLTAIPDQHSFFEGWGGNCSGISATCTVTFTSNISAVATFRQGR